MRIKLTSHQNYFPKLYRLRIILVVCSYVLVMFINVCIKAYLSRNSKFFKIYFIKTWLPSN